MRNRERQRRGNDDTQCDRQKNNDGLQSHLCKISLLKDIVKVKFKF
jgi:hypothetical protein